MHAGKPSLPENPIKFFFAQMPTKDKSMVSKEKNRKIKWRFRLVKESLIGYA